MDRLERLIARARMALAYDDAPRVIATLIGDGCDPSVAYLAVKAAIIANQ